MSDEDKEKPPDGTNAPLEGAPAASDPVADVAVEPTVGAPAEPVLETVEPATKSGSGPAVHLRRLEPERPARQLPLRTVAFVLGAGVLLTLGIGIPLRMTESPSSAPLVQSSAPSSSPLPVDAAADVLDAGVLVDAEPIGVPSIARPPNWRVKSLGADAELELVRGSVGKSPVLAALLRAGLPKSEAFRFTRALRPLRNIDRAQPEDSFLLAVHRQTKHIVAFEYSTSPSEVWQGKETDGKLEAKKLELTVEMKRTRAQFAIEDDVKSGSVKAGLDPSFADLLDATLEGHAKVGDLRAGTHLRTVLSEERIDGDFDSYRSIEALEITLPHHSSAVRIYRYAARGVSGYFDPAGRQPVPGPWKLPVPFARISSRFDLRRKHPVLHVVMPHNGIDFAGPTGTPVYSTAAGTVKFLGDSGPCGNMVHLLHENGLVSAYCHLQRFAAGMALGRHVEARQLIGYIGQTGRATGPHLHFAIKKGEGFIDPLSLKFDRVKVVPERDHADFEARRRELDRELEQVGGGSVSQADAGTEEGDEFMDEVVDGGTPP